jgi:hypothetical protein
VRVEAVSGRRRAKIAQGVAAGGRSGQGTGDAGVMKSAMPYHGVPTPLLRQLCKATFADVQLAIDRAAFSDSTRLQ